MEAVTREETASLRETPETAPDGGPATSEHVAPIGGLHQGHLAIRSGLSSLRLRPGANPAELYRASFEGSTPHVRLRDGRVLVRFKGMGFDWRGRVATFGLNTTIPWTVELVGGIQKVEADLRTIELRQLDIVGGAERVQLELGQPAGETKIRIVGGVKTLRRRAARWRADAARTSAAARSRSSSTGCASRSAAARRRSSRPAGARRSTGSTVTIVGGRSRSTSSPADLGTLAVVGRGSAQIEPIGWPGNSPVRSRPDGRD
jgi:hypothetical protein